MKCKLCQKEFTEPAKFHKHLPSAHKMTMEKYYRTYYPRYDLLDGQNILFKSYDYYFTSLFNSRKNMVTYFKQNIDKGESIFRRLLNLRKLRKNLTSAPSTVDSRTTLLPSPSMIYKLGMDYNAICASENLDIRFKYDKNVEIKIPKGLEIVVDTREQSPIDFLGVPSICSKLDFGDYSSTSHFKRIFVERKSLSDLCGTLSKGFERFKKEAERCKEMKCNLLVMVESPLDDLLNLKNLGKGNFSQASSEFICHRIREIAGEFSCLQFLFVQNRKEMADIIPKILSFEGDFLSTDFQYLYDMRVL